MTATLTSPADRAPLTDTPNTTLRRLISSCGDGTWSLFTYRHRSQEEYTYVRNVETEDEARDWLAGADIVDGFIRDHKGLPDFDGVTDDIRRGLAEARHSHTPGSTFGAWLAGERLLPSRLKAWHNANKPPRRYTVTARLTAQERRTLRTLLAEAGLPADSALHQLVNPRSQG